MRRWSANCCARFRRCWRGCWRLRGVTLAEAADYLDPRLKKFLPDPNVLTDMDRAVARVAAALEKGERIAVFGDYDVDGSTSAALLSEFLSALGAAPRIYIPDRMTRRLWPVAFRDARASCRRRVAGHYGGLRRCGRRCLRRGGQPGPGRGGAGSSPGRGSAACAVPMSIPTSRATRRGWRICARLA